MGRHRKKNLQGISETPVELNVMPFIDIFSLLTTFLLFTASFISFGILEVQVPFLSNAAPEEQKEEPKRALSLKIDATKTLVTLSTEWDKPPQDPQTYEFEMSDSGLEKLNTKLIEIKSQNKDQGDKLTLFTDDDINYQELTELLDAIKLKDGKVEGDYESLYDKVVLGSVIL